MGIFNQGGYRDQPPPQRGINGRLIAALLMAMVAIMMYYGSSQENPITGERQHVSLTPGQEVRLGLESAPLMSRQMGGEVSANDPRYLEVQKIGNYIVDNTDAKKSPWKFKFHLLADTKTVNAFALPGGQIFITLGLYNKLKTEAQLAGVLSHEMGHVIQRHSAQQMAKSQLGGTLVTAVGVGTGDERGGTTAAMLAASVVNQMMQLRYSRHDESEADQWGLRLMSQVGFTPVAMIEVMKILKAAGGGGGGTLAIFQTHPDPDLRIEQINAYLKEHPPSPKLTEGKALPQ